jgi:hypothetical protein
MIHPEGSPAGNSAANILWILISGPEDDDGPAGGPGGRGSTGPRVPSLIAGVAWCWSGWVGEDGDGSQAVAFGCTVQALRNTEPFSSFDLAGLEDVDGFGELSGPPGAAAEFAQDAPGLELGISAFGGGTQLGVGAVGRLL